MRISVSDIKLYATCPMKFHYQFRLRRGVEYREDAQRIGDFAHRILEAKLLAQPWDTLLEQAALEVGHTKDWPSIAAILEVWQPHQDWTVLSVEDEYTLPLGRHELVGRPDAVIEWNGKFWHLQHKTMAGSKPTDKFAETQRTDWHEFVYQAMLERAGYRPFGGTILNMIRKLSLTTVLKNPSFCYEIAYLPRPAELVTDELHRLEILLDKIEADTDVANIEKRRISCGGMYGNSICPYKPVCDGESTITHANYIDIKPRYTEAE